MSRQFTDTDNDQQRRIFEADDELVPERRDHPFESLGPDDVYQRLKMGQSDGTPRFHLPFVDGLDGSPDDLRNVGSGINRNCRHACSQGGNPHTEGQRQPKVKEHNLNHQRSSSDTLDINSGELVDENIPGGFPQAGCTSQKEPEDQSEKSDQDR